MLIRDFKQIDFSTDDKGNFENYHAERVMKDLKRIRQHFGFENKNGKKLKNTELFIDLRFHSSLIKPNATSAKGYDQPANYPILFTNTMEDKDGVSTWVFAKTANLREGGKYEYSPRREDFVGRMIIKDPHLIWYMICVHPNVKAISELSDIQNRNRGRMYYEISDPARAARVEIEEMRMTSKVENFIVDRDSPLTNDKIIKIAKSYGIAGADAITPEEVRMSLLKIIKLEQSKTGMGFERFIEASKVGKIIEVRAVIQTAIDLGRLYFDTKGASKKWRYGKEFENEAIITNVIESKKTDILVDHFAENPESYATFKKHVEGVPAEK